MLSYLVPLAVAPGRAWPELSLVPECLGDLSSSFQRAPALSKTDGRAPPVGNALGLDLL